MVLLLLLLHAGLRQPAANKYCNGWSQFAHYIVQGGELVTATTDLGLDDLGPHTWAQHSAARRLGEFPAPFYVEPFDHGGFRLWGFVGAIADGGQ